MKILVICQYYYPEPLRVQEICENLALNGHHVDVLTGFPNYPAGRIYKDYKNGANRYQIINNVHVMRVNIIPRRKNIVSLILNYCSYAFNSCIKALFHNKIYDIVFVYQLSPIIMALPAFIIKKKSIKTKILLYCLDIWPDSLGSYGIKEKTIIFKIANVISKMIYNHVDCLTYSSKSFFNYFYKKLKLKQVCYSYIPQFADDIFSEVKYIEHKGINIVFAGNIGTGQCVETIINAAYLVKNENIFFHIVGDGSSLKNCMKLAKNLNLLDRVRFYGYQSVSSMKYFYGIADAMILSLAKEEVLTLPGKIQSYMAAGKPIIAAVSGETALILEEAKCALISKAEDTNKLAENIEYFATIDYHYMEINSKKYFVENFSKNSHMRKFELILYKLYNERTK